MSGNRILKHSQRFWTSCYNLHVRLSKCDFLKPEVVYLSLKISAVGLQKVEEKIINAVNKAPAPRKVSEL